MEEEECINSELGDPHEITLSRLLASPAVKTDRLKVKFAM